MLSSIGLGVAVIVLGFVYLSAQNNPRLVYGYTQLKELHKDENSEWMVGDLVIRAPAGGEVCVVQDSTDLSKIVRSLREPTFDEGVWYVVRRSKDSEDVQWVRSRDYLLLGQSICSSSDFITLHLSKDDKLGYVARVGD